MKIPRNGSSLQQTAYAKRIFGGQGKCKKQIALECGYSPAVSNSVSSHVEKTVGFHNAMAKLAVDSNNLALAAMEEFQARGFKDFTNKDLVGALNAIGSAWSRFNAPLKEKGEGTTSTNKLRTVILQQIENQTNITPATAVDAPASINVPKDAILKEEDEF